MLSQDLGGSENKRSESQSYILCKPQAKLPQSMAITHFYSQEKATWTEDYMNITWEYKGKIKGKNARQSSIYRG